MLVKLRIKEKTISLGTKKDNLIYFVKLGKEVIEDSEKKKELIDLVMDQLDYDINGYIFDKKSWTIESLWGALLVSDTIKVIKAVNYPKV